MKKFLHCCCLMMLIGVFTLSVVGCTTNESAPQDSPPVTEPTEASSADETAVDPPALDTTLSLYSEAPMLATQVEAGTLPPVDDRLPTSPMVVKPVERVGVYGGTWHRGMKGNRDHANLIRTLGYENLMRWDEQWTRPIPNVAQSVEVNDDATEYTFSLRPGMRWSDGMPFTADDILFWYEDVFSNEAFVNANLDWLLGDKSGLTVEKIDDYTVVFRFDTPNGLFLQNLSHPLAADPTSFPRHYLEQFHQDYNPDIDALVEEAGVANWVELFELKFGVVTDKSIDDPTRWANAEVPSLRPWVLTNGYTAAATEVIAERNPYYWKIDTDGNQLPYIDQVIYTVFADEAELLTQTIAGNIDMQLRHIASVNNYAPLEENMAQGDYHFFRTISSDANIMAISLNFTHQDPVMRQIFQNRDFRIGLSHAIDRQKIIDELYEGNGQPYQVAPVPGSPHYHEQLATQYIEYDVDLANEYLDKAGYSERDEAGFRLGPDGKRITFVVEVSDFQSILAVAMEDYIKQDWQEVGIDVQIELESREQFYERKEANEHDVAVWVAHGGLDVILAPRYYFPFSLESNYAPLWARWYIDPTDPLAEEPPSTAQQQMTLYNQLKITSDVTEQNALMQQILDIAAEEFYVLGITLPGEGYGIVKNNFHNVPVVMPYSWTYPTPSPTNPAQYFIDQ